MSTEQQTLLDLDLTGESSDHKLAAIFHNPTDASMARGELEKCLPLDTRRCEVLTPSSAGISRQLLPESRGIWHTILRSHVLMGLAGALAGVTACFGLLAAGLPIVANNPWFAAFAFIHVTTLIGLMVGGLLSLRPDQIPYIRAAREALSSGRSVLILHARSADELSKAHELMRDSAIAQTRSA